MNRLFVLAVLAFVTLGAAQVSRAEPFIFTTTLSGANEQPPVVSPGTGTVRVTYDPVTHLMRVQATFSGLTTGTTAAHIHAPTAVAFTGNAGVATTTPTFAGFPSGVTSGTYDNTLDMTLASSYNPAFVTAQGSLANAEAVLFASMREGRSYFNIHTTQNPGGEIRGFLAPVPEPTTMLLLGTGLAGLAAKVRRKRKARSE